MQFVLDLLHQTMASPWIYLAIFTIAAIDGFFPAVPSETAVITAGVFAASGTPELLPVIGVAAAGALVGDHLSYLIGRYAGGRIYARMGPGSRRRAVVDLARRAVAERGGLMLVVARYIPGGRTSVTMTMGTFGYPRRSFSSFDLIAAGSWAIYSALVGYFGGMVFENDRVRGLLLGLGLAVTITIVVELIRYRRRAGQGGDEGRRIGSDLEPLPEPATEQEKPAARATFAGRPLFAQV